MCPQSVRYIGTLATVTLYLNLQCTVHIIMPVAVQLSVLSFLVILMFTSISYTQACSRMPWNVTLQEPNCDMVTVSAWACLGECHSIAKPTAYQPFYKSETKCCVAARYKSVDAYFSCQKGGRTHLESKAVDIIEECQCLSCTAKNA